MSNTSILFFFFYKSTLFEIYPNDKGSEIVNLSVGEE